MPRFLGILPVRAGSKGVSGKNIRPLGGEPLMTWAARALVQSESVDRKICSTDSPAMAEVARACGLEVPFLRPPELATDTSPVIDAITHALQVLQDGGDRFTHVVLVQATSPTVTSSDIEKGVALIREQEMDTVITAQRVTPHFHPAIMFPETQDGVVHWLQGPDESSKRRQDWTSYFARTGLFYIFSVGTLLTKNTLWGDRVGFVEVDPSRVVNIDSEEDFLHAEHFFQTRRDN